MDKLIDELIDIQTREQWSEREMARQIGISEASWHRIKSGSRGMGTSILRRVLHRFPELTPTAFSFFFGSDASHRSESAAKERAA